MQKPSKPPFQVDFQTEKRSFPSEAGTEFKFRCRPLRTIQAEDTRNAIALALTGSFWNEERVVVARQIFPWTAGICAPELHGVGECVEVEQIVR